MYEDYKYAAGKVIVALNKESASPDTSEEDIASVLDRLDYEKTRVIFHAQKTEEQSGMGDILLVYLSNKDQAAVADAIEKLTEHPSVNYAEPDYLEEMHLVPNDPLYQELWGLHRIRASLAWKYCIGSPRVAVGVIDTGIDYHHLDIRRNMWVSSNRSVVNGWNFAGNNRNSMDTNGHGTHVAGTIGAVGNNGTGITGVCWNVRVVSMKFGLDVASAIAAINFANQFHIPILNASWGGRAYSQALKDAIAQYRGLFIASAGNNGENNDIDPIYPASYNCDNIISVAATSPDDTLTGFSNYGVNSVDIAAPGANILSLDLHGKYSVKNGTSMSAPHVAGAAALLKAYMPSLSALSLKNIILSSAVRRPGLMGRVATGGILNANTMFEWANYLRRTEAAGDCYFT